MKGSARAFCNFQALIFALFVFIETILVCSKIPADDFESLKYHFTLLITYILTMVNVVVRMSIDVTFFWTPSLDRRCLLIFDLIILISMLIAYPKYSYTEYKRIK